MAVRGPKALVNPLVLQWLRTSSGFSVEEAARRAQTKPENVAAWEDQADEKRPSMAQLRRLAGAYKRPLSDFYLPRPSTEIPIPHDFRRLPPDGVHSYSPAMRYELRAAYRRRTIALDLADELDVKPRRFDALGTANLNDDPEAVGNLLRGILRVDFSEQTTWRQPRVGYNAWRRKAEALDVLVFQVATVEKSQMLGFSFAFDVLPIIAVNRKLPPNGRTFTLLHEFAHLILGERGICDLDEHVARLPREQQVEVFANHVAGSALVPKATLLTHEILAEVRNPQNWSEEALDILARDFCVSQEVVLRRLLIAGRTTPEFYAAKRRQYLAQMERQETARDEVSDDFRRNMPLEAASNLGAFARLVLTSYYSDTINLTDASKLLGVKADKVSAVNDYLKVSAVGENVR
jgi:Zn-dependent peptidase ImmA (M78 family)